MLKMYTYFLTVWLCLLIPAMGMAQAAKTANASSLPSKNSNIPSQVAAPSPPAAVAPPVTDRLLTGTVVNEAGNPLAGVTVTLVQDPNQSSITNSAGGYILHSKTDSPVLRVSYAGYQELQVSAGGSEPLRVQLAALNNYERALKKRSKAADKAYRKP